MRRHFVGRKVGEVPFDHPHHLFISVTPLSITSVHQYSKYFVA
jgi:hypothetical protein